MSETITNDLHTRRIQQRWFINGSLRLETPTHLSNGDEAPGIDLPLLLDPLEERPLLTGASLAGALRNYVNEYLNQYKKEKDKRSGEMVVMEKNGSPAQLLFGAARRDDEGAQSPLIVNDALGTFPAAQTIELRDGVRIDPKTRTAADQAKFDLELLPAGTTFNIGFELIVTKDNKDDLPQIQEALALALKGLQSGAIRLGGRKRRGYGECKVVDWQLTKFNLLDKAELKQWLIHGREGMAGQKTAVTGQDIVELLGVKPPKDQRNQLQVKATFDIDGSVLIRSGFEGEGPDMAHLESRRQGKMKPILSGTSLAGVMRGQALRIARTVSNDEGLANRFVRDLFGYMPADNTDHDKVKRASKVTVSETPIAGGTKLVQSRVAIDRFTGGALESALFEEQSVFGGQAMLKFSIKDPSEAEVGLLLLVLKDLWTGFIPIGGEAGVGRGRLSGRHALIRHNGKKWELQADGSGGVVGAETAVQLEEYVTHFVNEMKKAGAG